MNAAPPTAKHRPVALLEGILPYRRSLLARDIIAGVTLAALAIPEVMGYTRIAGTPVITGLYTILIPAIAFALFGSSRHLVVGGDSATAAILYAGIAGLGVSGLQPDTSEWVAYASLAALITAGLLLLARLARLGFLADFISRTVLIGFLTGVGIQVALGQLGGMLGVATPDVEDGFFSDTVIKAWDTLGEIPDASLTTVAVSIGVIATLLVFGRWFKAIPGGLVAVVGAIAISWGFDLESHGVAVLGSVPSGLPSIGLPSGVGWSDVVPLLGTSVSMVLVILAQSAATSRAYAIKYQERFVENNDLVGLSVANLAAGFSGTFPVNGSPTKTEMADEASSKTQVAMIAMAVTVAIVLLFLTKPLQYMPNAVLSAVVFLIGVKLVKLVEMSEIRRLRVDEFVIATVTAVVVVTIGVEQGIILAIVLSLLDHVRRHYDAPDAVVQLDANRTVSSRFPSCRALVPNPASWSIDSASACSTPTRRSSPQTSSPSSTSPSRRGGSFCSRMRWTTWISPVERRCSNSPDTLQTATLSSALPPASGCCPNSSGSASSTPSEPNTSSVHSMGTRRVRHDRHTESPIGEVAERLSERAAHLATPER